MRARAGVHEHGQHVGMRARAGLHEHGQHVGMRARALLGFEYKLYVAHARLVHEHAVDDCAKSAPHAAGGTKPTRILRRNIASKRRHACICVQLGQESVELGQLTLLTCKVWPKSQRGALFA
eukprot:156652-Chlamydomonas_euryale.AAC.1